MVIVRFLRLLFLAPQDQRRAVVAEIDRTAARLAEDAVTFASRVAEMISTELGLAIRKVASGRPLAIGVASHLPSTLPTLALPLTPLLTPALATAPIQSFKVAIFSKCSESCQSFS